MTTEANLTYRGESGGLNESKSAIFMFAVFLYERALLVAFKLGGLDSKQQSNGFDPDSVRRKRRGLAKTPCYFADFAIA